MKLSPVKVEWQAGRYEISITAIEEGFLKIKTTVNLSNGEEKLIQINFDQFAEIKFKNLNFSEHNYNGYIIKTPQGEYSNDFNKWHEIKVNNVWKETNICYNSFFFIVENSNWFEEKDTYQVLKKKGFVHYLLDGYDSYLEILAKEGIFDWKYL